MASFFLEIEDVDLHHQNAWFIQRFHKSKFIGDNTRLRGTVLWRFAISATIILNNHDRKQPALDQLEEELLSSNAFTKVRDIFRWKEFLKESYSKYNDFKIYSFLKKKVLNNNDQLSIAKLHDDTPIRIFSESELLIYEEIEDNPDDYVNIRLLKSLLNEDSNRYLNKSDSHLSELESEIEEFIVDDDQNRITLSNQLNQNSSSHTTFTDEPDYFITYSAKNRPLSEDIIEPTLVIENDLLKRLTESILYSKGKTKYDDATAEFSSFVKLAYENRQLPSLMSDIDEINEFVVGINDDHISTRSLMSKEIETRSFPRLIPKDVKVKKISPYLAPPSSFTSDEEKKNKQLERIKQPPRVMKRNPRIFPNFVEKQSQWKEESKIQKRENLLFRAEKLAKEFTDPNFNPATYFEDSKIRDALNANNIDGKSLGLVNKAIFKARLTVNGGNRTLAKHSKLSKSESSLYNSPFSKPVAGMFSSNLEDDTDSITHIGR